MFCSDTVRTRARSPAAMVNVESGSPWGPYETVISTWETTTVPRTTQGGRIHPGIGTPAMASDSLEPFVVFILKFLELLFEGRLRVRVARGHARLHALLLGAEGATRHVEENQLVLGPSDPYERPT